MKSRFFLATSLAVALAVPAAAHHSAAAYNTQQTVSITGPVTKYEYKNPHVYITVQAKNADGSTKIVEVEAGAPSVLTPLGFTKDSIAVGEVVTVSGNPSRTTPTNMLGKDLTKANGTYVPLNIASKSTFVTTNATATSIAGTWFSKSFTTFLGAAGRWPTTEAGTAAKAKADPKATTQKDCVPIGAPALMFYPVATTVKVMKDRVEFDVDWMDTLRVVYLDGRAHPPATETFQLGHSVGKWEGETLVVETTNFKAHPMGLSTTLPGSTQKKLIERFALGPDKKSLVYSGTVEDPVYLTRPETWTGNWEYRPTMQHSNAKCDLEVARKFLQD